MCRASPRLFAAILRETDGRPGMDRLPSAPGATAARRSGVSISERPEDADAGCLVATGIPGLDDILGGGLTADRVYLVQGNPGSGKTTLAIQYLLEGARRGEAGLYVTLSETRSELDAVARSHGWSLDAITILELVAPEEELEPENQYAMFQPSEVELGETTKAILAEVERVQAQAGRHRLALGDAAAGPEPAALPPAGARPQAVLHRAGMHGAAPR